MSSLSKSHLLFVFSLIYHNTLFFQPVKIPLFHSSQLCQYLIPSFFLVCQILTSLTHTLYLHSMLTYPSPLIPPQASLSLFQACQNFILSLSFFLVYQKISFFLFFSLSHFLFLLKSFFHSSQLHQHFIPSLSIVYQNLTSFSHSLPTFNVNVFKPTHTTLNLSFTLSLFKTCLNFILSLSLSSLSEALSLSLVCENPSLSFLSITSISHPPPSCSLFSLSELKLSLSLCVCLHSVYPSPLTLPLSHFLKPIKIPTLFHTLSKLLIN